MSDETPKPKHPVRKRLVRYVIGESPEGVVYHGHTIRIPYFPAATELDGKLVSEAVAEVFAAAGLRLNADVWRESTQLARNYAFRQASITKYGEHYGGQGSIGPEYRPNLNRAAKARCTHT